MAAFNLFANMDSLDDTANYSMGECNMDEDEVVELPEEKVIVSPKPAGKSKKAKGKASGKTKCNKTKDCSTPDNKETSSVAPGIGQKTAFKKLGKLKESLATTTKSDSTKRGCRSAMNDEIRHDFETQRARKRTRLRGIDELHRTTRHSPDVQQIVQSANSVDSFDEDELKMNIKLKWEATSKIEKYEFSVHKTFKELIHQLSTRDNIDAKTMLLMIDSDVLEPDDSPHTVGYTLGKFISVRLVDNRHLYSSGPSSQTQSNTIEVKIQSSQWKKPMILNIKVTDSFKVLTGMCAEKLKCQPNKIRFKFDGDILSMTSTPDDLDFEGGEILDLLMAD